jgi:hypothetical protein
MRTPSDLRTLYQLGISWDRAATALVRVGAPALAMATSFESGPAFGAAADSCRQLREAILTNPDGPLPRAFMAATRRRWEPHQLADLLEHIATTLTNLQEGSLAGLLMPRPALARLGEFLSDSGQEILRTVARFRPQAVAS